MESKEGIAINKIKPVFKFFTKTNKFFFYFMKKKKKQDKKKVIYEEIKDAVKKNR